MERKNLNLGIVFIKLYKDNKDNYINDDINKDNHDKNIYKKGHHKKDNVSKDDHKKDNLVQLIFLFTFYFIFVSYCYNLHTSKSLVVSCFY